MYFRYGECSAKYKALAQCEQLGKARVTFFLCLIKH
jgi:hypothetical protein